MVLVRSLVPLPLLLLFVAAGFTPGFNSQDNGLRFEIVTDRGPASGRLVVIIGRSSRPEPRFAIGQTGMDAPPILARDVTNLGAATPATLDRSAAIFPIQSLDALPPGDYYVQALLEYRRQIR